MKKAVITRTQISITAVGFDRQMQSYPRRIEIDGVVHQLTKTNACAAVTDGQSITHFFKTTDGIRDFLLKYENQTWELLS